MTARGAAIASAVALAAYLATGLVLIPEGEVGVVRRFGSALREPWPSGLHWGLPWGVDRVDRLAKDRERSITVGTRGEGAGASDFLTGDLNVVTARARVQYRVTSPGDYLFTSESADGSLAALGESALTAAVSGRSVDDVMGEGRGEIAERMRLEIQAGADARGLGVAISAVRLVSVAPPVPVAPAFADAERARSDQRRALNRAESYRDRAGSDAHVLARETADRAAARSDALIQSARGDAARFTLLSGEVGKNPVPARQKMYRDAMADLLPRFARKFIVAPGQEVDLNVTPGR